MLTPENSVPRAGAAPSGGLCPRFPCSGPVSDDRLARSHPTSVVRACTAGGRGSDRNRL